MNDSIPPLPGHGRKVTIAYGGSIAVVALGALIAIAGNKSSSSPTVGFGALIAGIGAIAGVRAFNGVRKAKCPRCETEMLQGCNGIDSDRVFACSKCGSKWKAAIRWGTS